MADSISMREKIARAIFHKITSDDDPSAWGRYPGNHHACYQAADAALDALMEPTEGMVDSGIEHTNMLAVPLIRIPNSFKAMILAAKEGK